jgi:hypothetical protein
MAINSIRSDEYIGLDGILGLSPQYSNNTNIIFALYNSGTIAVPMMGLLLTSLESIPSS